MNRSIRILHLEDNAADAELVQSILESAGIVCRITRVETGEEFGESLRQGGYDVILADYRLPAYDGMSALRLAQQLALDVPFIFVSGTMGEDAAIDGLTEGATDYVLKDKLARLEPAVKRALRDAENRQERKRAEAEVLRAKEEWERTFDTVPDLIAIMDSRHRIVRANRAMAQRLGMTPEQCVGLRCYESVHGSFAAHEFCPLTLTLQDGREHVAEVHEERLGGDFLVSTTPLRDEQGVLVGLVHVARDITERKQMEEELRKSRDALELRVQERTAELRKANEELRKVPSRLIAVQEEERKRLSSELHDSIGQTFVAVKYWIEMALKLRDECEADAALNHLEEFVPTLQRAIEETRSIYMGLRPSMLDSMGLLTTLEWLRRECMKLYPEHHVELETGIAEEEIPENLKINIFRIVQEALNNIVKHSKAEWVDVSLSKNGDKIELVVSDDGVGMDQDLILQTNATRGLGLSSMRERAELTGGCFVIESTPGEGTTIRACWPIEAEDQLP